MPLRYTRDEPGFAFEYGHGPARLTGANQIVGRIYVLSIHTFTHEPPDFLLGEVDGGTRIGKRSKPFSIGGHLMQDGDDNLAHTIGSTANHVEGFVLKHVSL
jgi:hypothetical protein